MFREQYIPKFCRYTCPCALGSTIAIVLMHEIQFTDVAHLFPKSFDLLHRVYIRQIVKFYEFSARYHIVSQFFRDCLFINNSTFFSARNNAIHFNNVSFIYFFFFNFVGREWISLR